MAILSHREVDGTREDCEVGFEIRTSGLTTKWDTDRFDKHQLVKLIQLRCQMIHKVFVLLLKIMIEENRLCTIFSTVVFLLVR